MIVLLGKSSHSASIGPPSRNVFSPTCPLSGPLKTQILVKFSQCGRTHRCEQDGVSGVKIGGSGARIGAFEVKTSALVPPSEVFFQQVDLWSYFEALSGAPKDPNFGKPFLVL